MFDITTAPVTKTIYVVRCIRCTLYSGRSNRSRIYCNVGYDQSTIKDGDPHQSSAISRRRYIEPNDPSGSSLYLSSNLGIYMRNTIGSVCVTFCDMTRIHIGM